MITRSHAYSATSHVVYLGLQPSITENRGSRVSIASWSGASSLRYSQSIPDLIWRKGLAASRKRARGLSCRPHNARLSLLSIGDLNLFVLRCKCFLPSINYVSTNAIKLTPLSASVVVLGCHAKRTQGVSTWLCSQCVKSGELSTRSSLQLFQDDRSDRG